MECTKDDENNKNKYKINSIVVHDENFYINSKNEENEYKNNRIKKYNKKYKYKSFKIKII